MDLNKTEIDILWKDFRSDSVKFSNFVRRFFLPREFSQIRRIRDKIELGMFLIISIELNNLFFIQLEKEIVKNQLSNRSNEADSSFEDAADEYEQEKPENKTKNNYMQQIKQCVNIGLS